jgi:ATP-dependent DNA helicase RecQ
LNFHGVEAFSAISGIMAGQIDPQSISIADPVADRLRRALTDGRASPLDLAILIRHVLIGEDRRRMGGPRPRLPALERLICHAELAGLGIDNGQFIAMPWHPEWLAGPAKDPSSAAAASERRRFGPEDTGPQADPFMSRLNREKYRSVGQRAAIRSALLAPPGTTTAIDLPTGEGKSLVFQTIDEIGFASDSSLAGADGVTLVIVPTVALAYDHENACRRSDDERLAYVGGASEECRIAIRTRVRESQRGLVFAAPESACRSLRTSLRIAARSGRLKAIVIDEAHLVDAWGTGFRADFQALSGLRRELLEAAPPGRAARTILLSATLSPETLDTLRLFFSDPGEFRIVSAGQVRPEPEYWVAAPSDVEQQSARVIEALCRLPRPAILYVTKVSEAKAWGEQLLNFGFRRLATFHGETPDYYRKQTLDRWRDGDLDLVVATSAFGLGIDYPHVRAIIHACVPETFDRFYQEVGRGGRDGCASVSVAIPAYQDFKVARHLNQQTVISVERGLTRWKAMFEHPSAMHIDGMRFRLRLDVAPGQSTDDIDLVGEKSLQWNARVLSLLTRAGILRLVGEQSDGFDAMLDNEDKDGAVFEAVEILVPGHMQEEIWRKRVEPVRQSIAAGRQRSYDLMIQHLRGDHCPADLLVKLYGSSSLDAICSSCQLCRSNPSATKPSVLRREPSPCWGSPEIGGALMELMLGNQSVVLTYRESDEGLAVRRRWAVAFDAILRAGFRSVDFVGPPASMFDRAIQKLQEYPVFVDETDGVAPPRLPVGPRVVLVAPGRTVNLYGEVQGSSSRLLILPENMQDIERPGEFALERFSGLVMGLDLFLARVH